jgi:hypothetical protein
MLSYLKSNLRTNLINAIGWRTNRKIVIFESDDWGAIRLPDISMIQEYRKQNPDTSNNPYLKYDSLASSDDLNNLFSVLKEFKDINGNHPIFTFNTVVANPDFEKIKENNFLEYFHEPFTETLKKYSAHADAFSLWQEAMKDNLMHPQFHGREHVNVPIWLNELRNGNKEFLNAFDLRTWSTSQKKIQGINPQATLDWSGFRPKEYQESFIQEGLSLFEEIFGFKSITMIPNNFILGVELHEIIKQNGINVIQGMNYQKLPLGKDFSQKRKMIRRYFGSENEEKLKYFVRNCQFEPSQTVRNYDDVNQCLSEISNSFLWNKPAIINSHRLNYIGVYDQNNRDKNLINLKILIKSILKKWPEVEFMDSEKLAIICNE